MKLGILGGGQLAAMLSDAAKKLDIEVAVFDPVVDCCAGLSLKHFCHAYSDKEALKTLADWADRITYEFENVPRETANFLSQYKTVLPAENALMFTQDRLEEKQLLNSIGIETAAFMKVDTKEDIYTALGQLGPIILKTRSGGYDGKGQWMIKDTSQVEAIFPEIKINHLIAEKCISFNREVSIIAVRSTTGDVKFYDLCENIHKNGILYSTRNCPGDTSQKQAESMISTLMDKLDYCGVLTLELFDCGGQLLANEYAPRVHNSGHWTIEGTEASQFENHVRAVCELPLAATTNKGNFQMFNIVGADPQSLKLNFNDAVLHDYKKKAKIGRKTGHITLNVLSSETQDSFKRQIANCHHFIS